MKTIATSAVETAAAAWRRDHWVRFGGLFQPSDCERWVAELTGRPSRQTFYPTEPDVRWEQISCDDDELPSPCDGLGETPTFLRLLERVTGLSGLSPRRSMSWLNVYRRGDRVPPHCDAVGDLQFLVCLQAPQRPNAGGQTFIGDITVPLQTGDALLWRATTLIHGMTPVESDGFGPLDASRVVFVLRYKAV